MPSVARTLRSTGRPSPASGRARGPRRALLAAALLATTTVAVAGCGASAKVPPALSRASMESTLKSDPLPTTPIPGLSTSPNKASTPRAVATLESEAGTVLPADPNQALTSFDAQINALRGVPVVVNLWGDWCVPCQKEIPVFQRVALAYRGRVAFLGVATFSTRSKTETYLQNKLWLPYPSVLDDHGQVVATTHVSNVPQTIFYSRTGKRFVHLGPYTSVADLETDIKRYTA